MTVSGSFPRLPEFHCPRESLVQAQKHSGSGSAQGHRYEHHVAEDYGSRFVRGPNTIVIERDA
jgi:hypothetical protein